MYTSTLGSITGELGSNPQPGLVGLMNSPGKVRSIIFMLLENKVNNKKFVLNVINKVKKRNFKSLIVSPNRLRLRDLDERRYSDNSNNMTALVIEMSMISIAIHLESQIIKKL